MTAKYDFNKEWSFDYSNLHIDNYSLFSSYKLAVSKNVRHQLNKFVVCKSYLTVHYFHASPTCTTYGFANFFFFIYIYKFFLFSNKQYTKNKQQNKK